MYYKMWEKCFRCFSGVIFLQSLRKETCLHRVTQSNGGEAETCPSLMPARSPLLWAPLGVRCAALVHHLVDKRVWAQCVCALSSLTGSSERRVEPVDPPSSVWNSPGPREQVHHLLRAEGKRIQIKSLRDLKFRRREPFMLTHIKVTHFSAAGSWRWLGSFPCLSSVPEPVYVHVSWALSSLARGNL